MSPNEARDPTTPTAHLVVLSKSSNPSIVEAIAQNPSTRLNTLWALAKTHPESLRQHPTAKEQIARNQNTPRLVLEFLAQLPAPLYYPEARAQLAKKRGET